MVQCMQGLGGPENPRRLNKWYIGRASECKIAAGVNGSGLERFASSVMKGIWHAKFAVKGIALMNVWSEASVSRGDGSQTRRTDFMRAEPRRWREIAGPGFTAPPVVSLSIEP